MGNIYKRGKIFWIKYYRNGIPYFESSKSQKETEAKKLLRKREGQVADGRFTGLNVERTLFNELADDLINDYRVNGKKSLDRALLSIDNLRDYFANIKAMNITTELVKAYIVKRQNEGKSNATINRELSALKRAFSLGTQSTPPKVLRIPYIPHLAEDNIRTGYFEHDEYLKFKNALPDYLQPVFTMGYYTGMRLREILNLTWRQVNIFEKKVTLEAGKTKNNESRIIFLTGELYDTLFRQKAIRDNHFINCPFVFFREGSQIKDFRYVWDSTLIECGFGIKYKCLDCGEHTTITDRIQLNKLTCSYCGGKKFKRDDKIFHDLRRTGARNMRKAGVSEKVIMKIGGWKTRTVFDRYNILDEDDLRHASEKVFQMHRETTEKLQNLQAIPKQLQNGYNPHKEVSDVKCYGPVSH